MTSYTYKADFFDFVDQSSARSALTFLQAMKTYYMPASVLDVGCGRGVWLAAWNKLGVSDVRGVDGDYVERSKLQIPADKFTAADLRQPLDLGQKYELVQCLEVAEHLPESAADTLIDNLARHGDKVLFSAAVPGQGGEFHVNEQPLDYWAAKFRARGFRVFDFPRMFTLNKTEIEPWYRYNTLLYVHERAVAGLPQAILVCEIHSDTPINFPAPLLWRLRCGVLRLLPQALVHQLAKLKHRVAA
jgi:SAM-dependent methyltransferase